MKYYSAALIPALIICAATAHSAGTLDTYVEYGLLKDCPKVIKSTKASNPLFQNGIITYTDTHTFICYNKYAFRHRWTKDAVSYRVLFWNGPTAEPIVINTKDNVVVQMLDHGNWTIQVEHIDALGNGRFSEAIFVNYNF